MTRRWEWHLCFHSISLRCWAYRWTWNNLRLQWPNKHQKELAFQTILLPSITHWSTLWIWYSQRLGIHKTSKGAPLGTWFLSWEWQHLEKFQLKCSLAALKSVRSILLQRVYLETSTTKFLILPQDSHLIHSLMVVTRYHLIATNFHKLSQILLLWSEAYTDSCKVFQRTYHIVLMIVKMYNVMLPMKKTIDLLVIKRAAISSEVLSFVSLLV